MSVIRFLTKHVKTPKMRTNQWQVECDRLAEIITTLSKASKLIKKSQQQIKESIIALGDQEAREELSEALVAIDNVSNFVTVNKDRIESHTTRRVAKKAPAPKRRKA